MRFAAASLALAFMAVGQAAAASITHAHHNHAAMHSHVEKRGDEHLSGHDERRIMQMGFKSKGENAVSNNGEVWIGKDGSYTNEFCNESGEPVILTIWKTSWVNANQPLITVSIPAGGSKTISFSDSASGAWSAIYKDTHLANGQVCNTWGEYTMGEWGTVDVSREVNMHGHGMHITSPKCVTDMETCVFKCPSGQTSCWEQYELHNCENGSQPGATYGNYNGAPSGGCGGLGSTGSLKTILS